MDALSRRAATSSSRSIHERFHCSGERSVRRVEAGAFGFRRFPPGGIRPLLDPSRDLG
jgi:hypothetical protein